MRFGLFLLCVLAAACGDDDRPGRDAGPLDAAPEDGFADGMADVLSDSGPPDVAFDSNTDATCASTNVVAEVANAPVDIIWVVDNSTSMEPAVRNVQSGLNDFVARVAASGLDYRVIMLSLRGRSASDRFPICIAPPLSGDSDCGDGPRFFHVSIDIRSTQPVEQVLGTLAQSDGYSDGQSRGSAPWRPFLREGATKTIVMVKDDNSRTCDLPSARCNGGDPPLTTTSLEDFPGGGNPFNSTTLGPGILTAEYGSLFEGYTFNAIYGWGDEGNPDIPCTYPEGGSPPSAGPTYTDLVMRTGGVRAQICQQSSSAAWGDFFEAIATRVEETARLSCNVELPEPPSGMSLDPTKVNVVLEADGDSMAFRKVADEASCGAFGGWYYDDEAEPTEVILCPSSCSVAQGALLEAGTANIGVQFGCDTILI